jgi:hypothetical protein
MKRCKGFIGPVGDDIPSIISILLALGLFFSGVTYALNAFNEKEETTYVLRGALEMGRAATRDVIMTETIQQPVIDRVSLVAQSYGINFTSDDIKYYEEGDDKPCLDNDYLIKHLVPVQGDTLEDITLRQLVICVRRL